MEKIKKTNIVTKILLVIACVAIILGIVFCIIGFDKKNNYYNSESFYSLNVNAYVGGDAYNYIINGTYFAGYLALAGALFICGCSCGIGGLLLNSKKREQQVDGQTAKELTTEKSDGLQLDGMDSHMDGRTEGFKNDESQTTEGQKMEL